MAKKRLPETDEELDRRRDQFFESFEKESDRGCVLVVASVLDECLEALLRFHMLADVKEVKRAVNPLFSTQGPLGSFWAKIQLAYALQLISAHTYEDLETIREIRNMFAHQYGPADFDDPAVAAVSRRLKAANLAVREIRKQEAGEAPLRPATRNLEPETAVRLAVRQKWNELALL
jgi:DNA-binding MltR family transcriptional regulator